MMSGLINDALELTFRGNCELTFAYNGMQGLKLVEEQQPDLVILDILMPEMDGYQFLRSLRSLGDMTPVIVLTALSNEEDEITGFLSGCDDYIIKPFTPLVLYHRVQAHLRRIEMGQGPTICYSDVRMDLRRRVVYRGALKLDLTPKEFQVLECFLRYPERVLKRDFLLHQVWGEHAESNVVDVYIGYLRMKMEAHHQSRLIQTVRGVGYILHEER
jgi:two-component system, OmpR family, response regulator MprA